MNLKDFEKVSMVKEAIFGAIAKGSLALGKTIVNNPLKSLSAGFIGAETVGSGMAAAKQLPKMKSRAVNNPYYKQGLE